MTFAFFRHQLKKAGLVGITFVLALSGTTFIMFRDSPTANALVSGSDWQAGRIIDDDIFYSNGAMSTQDIQSFLNSLVLTCDTNGTAMYNGSMTNAQYAASRGWPGPAYVCLKDYYQVPRSDQNINNLSTNIVPNGAISAAQIIKNAADSYGINPKVLLVTLEKESLNLLKDNWPLPNQYRNPMGYGCPDTAPCDPQYEGFYNQVTNAARQFKLYKDNPNSYRYRPSQDNSIAYQANSPSCGASNVYISTYATAGLYNYTPYQPNQAALNNMYGTGDGCSAYGNRNFWRIFNDWFGSTTIPKSTLYIPDGNYMVKNSTSGRFVDVAGGNTSNGARAQIYSGNGSNAQIWQTKRLSNGNYTFKNIGSGRFLDVSGGGTTNGTPVQIYDGNGGCAQQWAAVSVGTALSLMNACSGKALDISGGNFGDATKLQIYSRNYSGAQLWSLVSTGAPIISNGYYKVSASSNLKMTPSNSDASTQISSDANNDSQTWQFYRQPDGTYRLRNKSSNKLLTASTDGSSKGSQIGSSPTNGTCPQSWIVQANQDGSYTLQSACYGYVVDIINGDTSVAGTKLQLWDSNGTDAQKWHLTKVANIGITEGDYIMSNVSGKVLDVAGGNINNGTKLQIWDSNGTDAQKWHLAHVHDNVYQLSNITGSKVADLTNASTINGTNVQIWSSNSTCAQQWEVVDNGDTTYTLTSSCDTTKALDISNGNVSTNGTKIQLYTSNSSNAQRWTFIPLSQ